MTSDKPQRWERWADGNRSLAEALVHAAGEGPDGCYRRGPLFVTVYQRLDRPRSPRSTVVFWENDDEDG